jgi:acetyltransferase
LDCHPAIGDISEKIDLAIIATPPQTVPDILEECGQTGSEGVIIISSGFREMGEEGRKLEEQLTEIIRRRRMKIIGPESLGIIQPASV